MATSAASDAIDRYLAIKYPVYTDSWPVNQETGELAFQPKEQAAPPTDWSSYLQLFGVPADVRNELNAIFQRTPDVRQATALALAYVRGTDWYKQTYPGIQEAVAKGIVRDEADYRSRMNDFNQVYRQFAGRDISPDEYAGYLREGVDAATVGRRFEGSALADTYGGDWQYLAAGFGTGRLSGDQLAALGRQSAGLSSPGGIALQKMIQDAQQKLSRVFEGVLATGPTAGLERAQQRQQLLPDIGR